MEEARTNNVTQDELLMQWWNQTDFTGKSFFTLKDHGVLAIRPTPNCPERTIATLAPETADITVKALVEKFPEIQQKNTELQQEWDATTDKLKLYSKVLRHKDYLLHTHAIGDFDALLRQVAAWEQELNSLTDNNYQSKLAIVEEAEKVAAASDTWKETTQYLKELAEKWKNIGFSDKQQHDILWSRFEKARENFFERKRTAQEEMEKEQMRNLDIKLEIVDKAERLAASDDWRGATDGFRQLLEQWKATGRAGADKNEQLWRRFLEAQNIFYNRKRAHFEEISKEQEANYALKLVLVEKSEALRDSTDWNKTAQAYTKLNEEWKKIGKVPADKADEIWNLFRAPQEHFFNNRRHHLESVKVTLDDNYAQKLALVNRAEALKESTLWRETTIELEELLAEWKKIGPVPRAHTHVLWERFMAARKQFFERKDAARERRKVQIEKQEQSRLQHTQDFYRRVESELNEEKERLEDLREALMNVTAGPKEKELRAHLQNLIQECETKIKHKTQKVEDARKQAQQILVKKQKQQAEQKAEAAPEESTSAITNSSEDQHYDLSVAAPTESDEGTTKTPNEAVSGAD